jgi:nucleoid-associated protein YgaU
MEKSNTFAEISIAGLESPFLQFAKGNSGSITLEAFYDTYEDQTDVRKYTDELTNLMNLDTELHAPPILSFIWGQGASPFICVLERITKRFTMFLADGTPVRARINITLKEYKLELNTREKALKSSDKTKAYTVKQGDSLWSIANREFGNPYLWREIADQNNISNPRFIEPGTELVIPALGEKG